jgi:uncharacterized protein YlxW (UPF0749 family)
MKPIVLATLLAATLASAANAQVSPLPTESRAEREVQQTNRAMREQEQQLQQREQTQFDLNQLRDQNEPHVRLGRGLR